MKEVALRWPAHTEQPPHPHLPGPLTAPGSPPGRDCREWTGRDPPSLRGSTPSGDGGKIPASPVWDQGWRWRREGEVGRKLAPAAPLLGPSGQARGRVGVFWEVAVSQGSHVMGALTCRCRAAECSGTAWCAQGICTPTPCQLLLLSV